MMTTNSNFSMWIKSFISILDKHVPINSKRIKRETQPDFVIIIIEPRHEKRENLFMPYANNKGADQPAHTRSLISAFVVRCLDSIIPLLAKSKIYIN